MDRPNSPEDRETIPHLDVMRVLLERAEFVRSVLLEAMDVIRDPGAGRAEALNVGSPIVEDDATRVANAAKVINDLHGRLFKNEKSRPWLMFVRSIEQGARHANETKGSELDLERARVAREYYRRSFPDLEQKLTDAAVVRAVTEWRKQATKGSKNKNPNEHWIAIHQAVKCFTPDAPSAESMSKVWLEDFPHLPWQSEKTKR
jgi:hypothetical protein